MEFLGIGPLELLFFAIIALLLFGPQDMAKAGRTIGRFLRRIVLSEEWRAFNQGMRELRRLPTTLMREAGLEEDEMRNMEKLIQEPFQKTNMLLRDLARNTPDITINTPPDMLPAAEQNSAAGYGAWSGNAPPPTANIQTPPPPEPDIPSNTPTAPEPDSTTNADTPTDATT